VSLTLTSCTHQVRPEAVSLEELRGIAVDSNSCKNLDNSVIFLENQQRIKGIPPTAPELLNQHDREYQARIRILVWSLRIGCANPDMFK
jgi:hypothetical protein